jgi:hypothetical protein
VLIVVTTDRPATFWVLVHFLQLAPPAAESDLFFDFPFPDLALGFLSATLGLSAAFGFSAGWEVGVVAG